MVYRVLFQEKSDFSFIFANTHQRTNCLIWLVHEELIPYNFHWRQKKERKREKMELSFCYLSFWQCPTVQVWFSSNWNNLNYRGGKTLLLLQRFNKEGIIFYFLTSKVLQFQSNFFEGFHFAQATSQTEWKHLPCSLKGFRAFVCTDLEKQSFHPFKICLSDSSFYR